VRATDGTGKLEGRAEKLLGDFAAASARGSSAFVATKLAPYPSRLTAASFVDAARASAARLRRAKLDVVQSHWSTSNYAPWQETALQQGLADVYHAGLADAIGVSNYGPRELRKIHAALAARGVPLVSAQVQYSLLSREPERSGMRAACDELGVTLIAYSPLCLGALTGRFDADGALPAGPRGLLLRSLLRDAKPLLALMAQVAAAHPGATVAQVAVNWCRAKGTLPIPGVHTVAQARDALGCLAWALDTGELAELDKARAALPGLQHCALRGGPGEARVVPLGRT
jgi:pyridoxine 4-dehydrogenase